MITKSRNPISRLVKCTLTVLLTTVYIITQRYYSYNDKFFTVFNLVVCSGCCGWFEWLTNGSIAIIIFSILIFKVCILKMFDRDSDHCFCFDAKRIRNVLRTFLNFRLDWLSFSVFQSISIIRVCVLYLLKLMYFRAHPL